MNEMCDNLTAEAKNHAFIICTGDLAEAGFQINASSSAPYWFIFKNRNKRFDWFTVSPSLHQFESSFEALPVDEGQENLGRLPGIRPGETSEFFDTMRNCPTDLPFFTLNGNRDIENHIFREHAWKGYEKQFMDRLLSMEIFVEILFFKMETCFMSHTLCAI